MRTHLKSIAGFLIAFILFQGCVSAKSVTVDEAVHQETRVRIKTIDGETYRYKKLIRRDNILYGVKNVKGIDGLVDLKISHLNIIEVKYMSPGKTVALVIVSVVGVIIIIGIIDIAVNGFDVGI